jgi:hypothetical protein
LRVIDDRGLTNEASFQVRVPPKWLTNAASEDVIVVEAENFVAQKGGEVRLYERVGASGKMLTYWHENIGHTLTWNVHIPSAGDYVVALKYCTGSERTMRDFKIDGACPRPELASFHLPFTGGFSGSEDNWAYLRLGEWAGEPFRLNLSEGSHEFSMTNLNDGCGLDQIFFIRARDK